jgi:hypothetical protein
MRAAYDLILFSLAEEESWSECRAEWISATGVAILQWNES